jgi:hypothetical protein
MFDALTEIGEFMKRIVLLSIIALALVPFESYAAKPIQDLVDVPVPVRVDGTYASFDEVQRAIIKGCTVRGWTPTLVGEGQIRASILVRSRHYAEVEILFTDRTYSITYKASRNLDYNEKYRKIHRNYNKWVANLSASIQQQFRDS